MVYPFFGKKMMCTMSKPEQMFHHLLFIYRKSGVGFKFLEAFCVLSIV